MATTSALADYLVNGFWAASGGQRHQWGNPASITVNLAGLALTGEIAQARAAMRAWERVANIKFTETAGSANITFTDGNNNSTYIAVTSAGWSTPSGNMTSATINISQKWYNTNGGAGGTPGGFNNYSFQSYLHELGHAIGLGHQGNYDGSATYGTSNAFVNDSWQFSVMSYFDQTNYGGASYAYVSGPQMADIMAVQTLYGGAITTTNYFGDSPTVAGEGYDFANGVQSFTMYSSNGWAALRSTSYTGAQTINMKAGTYSSVRGLTNNVGLYTQTTMTEYYGGSGSDDVTLTSDALPAQSRGYIVSTGGGNDTIRSSGSQVAHVIDGGAGLDTYVRANLTAGSGTLKRTSQSGNTWLFTDSTRSSYDTLVNIEQIQFSNGMTTLRQARSNFNFGAATNDVGATSDLLLRDGSGNVLNWTMQSYGIVGGTSIGGAAGWTVLGTGDFDADGSADVLLRNNSTNAVAYWTVKNGLFSGSGLISSSSSGYGFVGTGDIDNNGAADVVMQNGSLIAAWKNNNGVATSVAIGNAVGYGADAVGDINGDGTADIIMHDANGNLDAWLMNSSRQVQTGVRIGSGFSGYSVVGVGDFNGDGTTDILLRQSSTGNLVDLQMLNGAISQTHNLGYDGGWKIVGIGDYNGDGTADIAFQQQPYVSIWRMANGFYSGTTIVAGGLTGYTVQG